MVFALLSRRSLASLVVHRPALSSHQLLANAMNWKPNGGRPSSDLAEFREIFKKARNVIALTGAGISAESGVPTFRGSGGLWRTYRAQDLATPEAFSANPSRVWEFYSYRRDLVKTKQPNAAHQALVDAERRVEQFGGQLTIITQNIDDLHKRAGSRNVIELHGALFKTKCMKCGDVAENHEAPICPALEGKGNPDPNIKDSNIPIGKLPHCTRKGCDGLLRPHVVWFGEPLDPEILDQVQKQLNSCDLCLVIGTSSIVYPAALFAPQVAARGVPVAEFNIETTPTTIEFGFHFEGPSGSTLPQALAP